MSTPPVVAALTAPLSLAAGFGVGVGIGVGVGVAVGSGVAVGVGSGLPPHAARLSASSNVSTMP
ncbi:MAG TPA: hypothetical protein DCL15_09575 [Chloroflexi bacterium]|nr:hypothetical protein [Chloroflexota bacterium]